MQAALAGLDPEWVDRSRLVHEEGRRSEPRARVLLPLLADLNRLGLPDASYETMRDSGTLHWMAQGVYAGLQLPYDSTPEPADQADIVGTAKDNLEEILAREPSGNLENIYWDREHEDLGYYCYRIFEVGAEYSSDTERVGGDEVQEAVGNMLNQRAGYERNHFARRAKHELYELVRFLEGSQEGRLQLQNFRQLLTQKDADGRYPYLPLRTEELYRFAIDLDPGNESEEGDGAEEAEG